MRDEVVANYTNGGTRSASVKGPRNLTFPIYPLFSEKYGENWCAEAVHN